jgi:hypothetical protein
MRQNRKEIAKLMVPGFVFMSNSGAIVRVVSREAGEFGLELELENASENHVSKSKAPIMTAAARYKATATMNEFLTVKARGEVTMSERGKAHYAANVRPKLAARNALRALPRPTSKAEPARRLAEVEGRLSKMENMFGKYLMKQLDEPEAAQ